jgi:opacity protein-like surface antigen
MKKLAIVFGLMVLFSGAAPAADLANAEILSADFSGIAAIHPAGERKATLHVRGFGNPGSLFAVLDIADEHGVFGQGNSYRFSDVKFEPSSGHLTLHYQGMSGVGEGYSIDVVDASLQGVQLSGTFTSNQVAPDGDLIEGPLQMALSKGSLKPPADNAHNQTDSV